MTALPLHTVTAGDPVHPPIVLLHGFSMSHAIFAPLMALLSDRFYLIAPDLRGHGLSPKPVDAYASSADWAADIAQIIAPLDRPVLLGWSMGGRVVMDYILIRGAISAFPPLSCTAMPTQSCRRRLQPPIIF